jgi:hypothetical protein
MELKNKASTSHGTGLALIFAEFSSRYGLDTRERDMVVEAKRGQP